MKIELIEKQSSYGVSSHEFKKTGERINLGKRREHLRQEGTKKDDQIGILR